MVDSGAIVRSVSELSNGFVVSEKLEESRDNEKDEMCSSRVI